MVTVLLNDVSELRFSEARNMIIVFRAHVTTGSCCRSVAIIWNMVVLACSPHLSSELTSIRFEMVSAMKLVDFL